MIRLIHPIESPTGNKFHKRHWSHYAKWKGVCVIWALSEMRANRHSRAISHRRVKFIAYRRRTLDEDNLTSGLKALRDSLTKAGYLVDDSPRWATFDYKQEPVSKSPNGKPCTLVELVDEEQTQLKGAKE